MNASFFAENRRRLFEVITSDLIILTAYDALQLKGDMAVPFRQESNFWYVTGIEEPGWVVVLERNGAETLYAPHVDDVHAVFDGQLSPEAAKEVSGIATVLPAANDFLDALRVKYAKVASLGIDPRAEYYDFVINPMPENLRHDLVEHFDEFEDIRGALAKLRAIKQPGEIAMMRKAADITVEAFNKVHENIANYNFEYEIEADFTHYFRSRGCIHAYEPIVASGKNACTLHYVKNSNAVTGGELVLLDIGAEVGGYAADVTRTYAFGPITERQQAVLNAVQEVQQAAIALLRPGLSVKEYHQKTDELMKQALIELHLYKTEKDFRRYFPHAISHGLGIDVHDSLGRPEIFQPGMVLTVEPGIYIPEESIGVRIEDDILITEDGHENLTAAAVV